MTKALTVSIVLYRTPEGQLSQCIYSLKQFSGQIYLYLVDNSPEDSLRPEYIVNLPHEYIHLPENPGFGAGHNVAIKKARMRGSSYHLVLNADVSFSADVLTPMIIYMEGHPKVGQMMPKVLNADGSIQRLCKLVPTPMDLMIRRFMGPKYKTHRNRHYELHDSGYDRIMFVPYLSGCFMLLRQSALSDIGFFDERFFMYPEDIDLTRRMAEKYDTIFFPEVSVVHQHGAESYKSLKMLFIHMLNIVRYFNKWGWLYDPIRNRLNHKALKQFPPIEKVLTEHFEDG